MNWAALIEILGLLLKWWVSRGADKHADLIAAIQKRQDGWKNENGDIFGGPSAGAV